MVPGGPHDRSATQRIGADTQRSGFSPGISVDTAPRPGHHGAVDLPGGHTARAPRLDDVAAIAGLVRDYTRAAAGIADYTVDDARDELTEPGFDPELGARLVFDPAGRAVGYATTSGKGDGDLVDLDVVAPDAAVAGWLFAWALARAGDIGRERGLPRVRVDHGAYRVDEALRDRLAAHGFGLATTFHRMRVDHVRPVPTPTPPAGVVLRRATEGDTVRRVAHEVLHTAFADHFGFAWDPYETWHANLDRKSTFDWSQLWVAELDGRAVGVLECTDQFVDEENCGYIADVGILAEARGRGIAKYLLRHAFAADAAAGRTGTILHVDSNNTTPALGLYESVGMRPVLVIDVWRRTVDAG